MPATASARRIMPGIPVDEAHRRGGVVPHHMGFALGEAVKAIVVLRPDQCVSADEIIAHARERIAGHKLPKSVDFVDALPRTAAGKVLRPPFWNLLACQEGKPRAMDFAWLVE
jgi:acyl-CoA synthetase (AMP-forming)/AMP-acid ligase II